MNGVVIIDKGEGWTSHDVVAKLRGLLREKRIGHGGTLDPMATGVLPVFVGRATRAVEFCESFDKEYIAGLRLGLVTDTQDTTGTILSTSPVSAARQDVEDILRRFTGAQEQIPPMYSAVKIGGKRLYELARRGIETARAPRPVTISTLELLEMSGSDILLRVVCSKGTYIRTLCHDIGQALGCGGAMFSLRRTRAGSFQLQDAVTLADIEALASAGKLQELLKPVDALFDAYPTVVIDARQKAKCLNGAEFSVSAADGLYRVYDENHVFLMLGRAGNGVMRTVKSFFEV
ncbi:tRNA pseudouridine55 synthase [Sporobacter termitidis DSM 10068]|uniref:tRNA pseudouridine synthase B n=1 Tax=Sporobacter termitidis DSM 10068 TaxID=1123282 RepID=A0A1M5XZ11_9FIRM|nr:tRNA pseudouridine(55) synthase TruB [Sporobacter termitidis]SHI04523.1 tRNA pseudouridine55 synthase [Sporobacter termitidis DSM 10068]